jgi:16S rRNA (uracil1498-N3)-methyltransferase
MARRLYFADINTGNIILVGPEAHHGKDVLRLRATDEVELFDGQGRSAPAAVISVGRSEIALKVEAIQHSPATRPKITLATAMPKFAHQEVLVRMCTELGVTVFSPIIYERSSVREQFREEKWQRWTLEACKQCGQNYLPAIHPARRFSDFLNDLSDNDLLIFGSTVTSAEHQKRSAAENIVIFIGPEGGFTPQEEQTMLTAGAMPIHIGSNILRIETAAVALTTFSLL